MTAALATEVLAIVHRTRGRTHGPITRLVSPGDLGEFLKPFVFLDRFGLQSQGSDTGGFGMHPHSGIATLTYMIEGSTRYEDTTGEHGELKDGERWRYTPPAGHQVAWVAVDAGRLAAGDRTGGPLGPGELAVFEESGAAIDFLAHGDTVFVLGSAVKHPHPLVTGYYSVHTSKAALDQGEAKIRGIGARLRQEGRLG